MSEGGGQVEERDWARWHSAYDDPDSRLARRLAVVRARVRELLDAAPAGRIGVVSMCAGQGRDLLGAVAGHPRAADVSARLVELDPRNVVAARAAAATAGVAEIEVVEGDAALTDNYAGAVPAQLVLACGIFGNVTAADVARTIGSCHSSRPSTAPLSGARHRREPDLVPAMADWFAEQGFAPVWLPDKAAGFGVGVHRFTGTPVPLRRGERMFAFTKRAIGFSGPAPGRG